MHQRLFLFIFCVVASAQPTVTAVVIDAVSHSEARVTATSSAAPVPTLGGVRVRYGLTTSYEIGAGGGLNNQGFGACINDANFCPGINQIYATLSGLAPSTLYHVQMQASSDGGLTWGSSSDATFTTASLPGTHPAYPIAPETFSTAMPNTSGYTTAATATSCSDLNTKLATAVNSRGSGWILPIAPGLLETTSAICIQPPVDPSALAFATTAVNTSTNTFTITSHGLALNERIEFGTTPGSCLPSSNPSSPNPFCSARGNLHPAVVYYVVNPTANTFQVAATLSGSPLALTDQGSGTNYVVPVPASGGPQIIIRPTTADSAFCPEGSRCMGSVWASKMAKIQVAGGLWNSVNGSAGPLVFQTNIGAHDIRFVGIEITNSDAGSLANTSTDPRPTYGYIYINDSDAASRIIFDRCYIHGLGYPNRIYRPLVGFDAAYVALINSDLEQWDFWRPWLTSGTPLVNGFTPAISSKTVNYASSTGNTYYMGTATCTAPSPLSITFSGSSSGTAYAYFTMGCVPTFQIPTGMSATCAGTGSDNGGPPQPCVVSAVATPAYPVDAANGGGLACGELGTITVSAGTPTSAGLDRGFSQYATEGTQGMIAGCGPGPFQFYNNYVSGAGLLWHFDSSCSGVSTPKSYVLQRNTFFMPLKYITGQAGSDNFDYGERNGPEWKNGQNGLIDGNTWTNYFAGRSSLGSAITLGARAGAQISDFEIKNNTFTNGANMLTAIGGIASIGEHGPAPFQRLWVHNNLNITPNGTTQFSEADRSSAFTAPLDIGWAMEDLRFEHNTFFNAIGSDPVFLHLTQNPIEGMRIADNILWVNNDNNAYGLDTDQFTGSVFTGNVPACTGLAKAAADCGFTQGIGNPSYTFAGNVMVPYWSNSQTQSVTVSASTLCSDWGGSGFFPATTCTGLINRGGTNYIRGDATTAARLAAIAFQDQASAADPFALKLAYTSPYISGAHAATDGADVGVNANTLLAAQGAVGNPTMGSITTIGANVHWWSYDGTTACAVDYATFPNDPSTHAGGGRLIATATNAQSVSIGALTSKTQYNFRVLCPVQQPTGSFVTR